MNYDLTMADQVMAKATDGTHGNNPKVSFINVTSLGDAESSANMTDQERN